MLRIDSYLEVSSCQIPRYTALHRLLSRSSSRPDLTLSQTPTRLAESAGRGDLCATLKMSRSSAKKKKVASAKITSLPPQCTIACESTLLRKRRDSLTTLNISGLSHEFGGKGQARPPIVVPSLEDRRCSALTNVSGVSSSDSSRRACPTRVAERVSALLPVLFFLHTNARKKEREFEKTVFCS